MRVHKKTPDAANVQGEEMVQANHTTEPEETQEKFTLRDLLNICKTNHCENCQAIEKCNDFLMTKGITV